MDTTEISTLERRGLAADALFALRTFLASEPRLLSVERDGLAETVDVLVEYKETGV